MINSRDLFKVYFAKPVGTVGPIKIGISINPEYRCRECEAWSPFLLELIGSVPGRKADENFLHDCLADHHSHGEWFHAAPLVLEMIDAVVSAGGFDAVRANFVPIRCVRSKKISDTRARYGSSLPYRISAQESAA